MNLRLGTPLPSQNESFFFRLELTPVSLSREPGLWLHAFVRPRCHGAQLPVVPNAPPRAGRCFGLGFFQPLLVFFWQRFLHGPSSPGVSSSFRAAVTSPVLLHPLSGAAHEPDADFFPFLYRAAGNPQIRVPAAAGATQPPRRHLPPNHKSGCKIPSRYHF